MSPVSGHLGSFLYSSLPSCRLTRFYKPDVVNFYYKYEPTGEWWEKAKPYLNKGNNARYIKEILPKVNKNNLLKNLNIQVKYSKI